MFKNHSKYSWFSFVPFTLLSLISIVLLVHGSLPVSYLWGTLVMWVLISGLGVSTGYHRVFSHKTHDLPRWKENILLFFGALSGQGSSIMWAAIHRGYHHKNSDRPGDLHSPVIHTIYHAFFGWTLKITENSNSINIKYSVDLLRKSNHVWFHQNNMKILWGVPFLVALFDWRMSLVVLCLPIGISLIQDNFVNVIGHLKGKTGYRNFSTKDNSQNHLLLAYITWGQLFHNNHHHAPSSYNFGYGVSRLWWEIDPCVIFLLFLGKPKHAKV